METHGDLVTTASTYTTPRDTTAVRGGLHDTTSSLTTNGNCHRLSWMPAVRTGPKSPPLCKGPCGCDMPYPYCGAAPVWRFPLPGGVAELPWRPQIMHGNRKK